MASRETLEENIAPYEVNAKKWKPTSPAALSPDVLKEIGDALLSAKLPVVVTTYLGRDNEAVAELIKLADTLGVAVLVSRLAQSANIWLTRNRKHFRHISISHILTNVTWVATGARG
jgi:thiamine pyrophosphate-dependent acetolactate synthase large subunit-like protein